MRKIAQATVLTAFSTLLGLIPLTASAQIAPNQVVICSSRAVKSTFKLDGKVQALEANECGTYSGRSTYLFYTEYGRNPRYTLKRVLAGGERYDFQQTPSGLDVVLVTPIPR
jgi:hypothetical protein